MDGFWINDFDLSTLTAEQFSPFFFDRPIVKSVEATRAMYLGEFEAFAISVAHPAAMVANVQAMCRNFAELAKIYSPEQLDQGLWAIFGTVRCGKYLFDSAINSRLRTDCVESMYPPFKDVVARRTTSGKDSFYWMWWDEILRFRSYAQGIQIRPCDSHTGRDHLPDTVKNSGHSAAVRFAPSMDWGISITLRRSSRCKHIDKHRKELTLKTYDGLRAAVTALFSELFVRPYSHQPFPRKFRQ